MIFSSQPWIWTGLAGPETIIQTSLKCGIAVPRETPVPEDLDAMEDDEPYLELALLAPPQQSFGRQWVVAHRVSVK